MKKGNLGFHLWIYAAGALLLTFLGQTLALGVLLGFVLLVEKDDWLSRQVMQALALDIGYSVVMAVVHLGCTLLVIVPFVGSKLSGGARSLADFVGSVVLLCVVLRSLGRVRSGRDADIPGARRTVERAYGIAARAERGDAGAERAPDPSQDNAAWTCPKCSALNAGNFCRECGTPRNP